MIQSEQKNLAAALEPRYGKREAELIAALCLEKLSGLRSWQLRQHPGFQLTAAQLERLAAYRAQLLAGRPVQYVLEEAWFQELPFYVNEAVLIPRPETEELVEWVAEACSQRAANFSVLDVGTGSGCIAIGLARRLPEATVTGCDVSVAALAVARCNGESFAPSVRWVECNFLDAAARANLPPPDVLVSNPPYIPLAERSSLEEHVYHYEPATALFVPDEKPLLFYEAIAAYAREFSKPPDIFMELHAALSGEVAALFRNSGFGNQELRKDMQGQERMLRVSCD